MWYGANIKFDIDTILFFLLYNYYLMWHELPIYVYVFLISSTDKVFCHQIKDLEFDSRIHQKTNWYS